MPKQQLNLRISDLTARQLDALTDRWGTSKTETITMIIDRMYREEHSTMRTNRKYYAWANNDQGASTDVTLPMSERRRGLRAFEDAARTQLGSGWTVHIMAVDIDGDGQSVMSEPYEIKKFTIR